MTALLLTSLHSLVPPVALFGIAPHYFALNSSLHILKVLFPAKTAERLDYWLYHNYQAAIVYFFEIFSETKVIFYGDRINQMNQENVIYISNHRSSADWSLVNFLGIRQNSLGQMRYMIKDTLKFVPFYGLYLMLHGCIFVKTRSQMDNVDMNRRLKRFMAKHDQGYWIAIFPEGTRYSLEKREQIEKSNTLALKKGLAPFKYTLFPKTKGIELCLDNLTNLDAVYDVTIGLKSPCTTPNNAEYSPGIVEFVSLRGREVHMHFKRIPIDDIPKDAVEREQWIYKRFQEKNRLLSHFFESGESKFPGESYRVPVRAMQVLPAVTLNGLLLIATLCTKQGRRTYMRVCVMGLVASLFTPFVQKYC